MGRKRLGGVYWSLAAAALSALVATMAAAAMARGWLGDGPRDWIGRAAMRLTRPDPNRVVVAPPRVGPRAPMRMMLDKGAVVEPAAAAEDP